MQHPINFHFIKNKLFVCSCGIIQNVLQTIKETNVKEKKSRIVICVTQSFCVASNLLFCSFDLHLLKNDNSTKQLGKYFFFLLKLLSKTLLKKWNDQTSLTITCIHAVSRNISYLNRLFFQRSFFLLWTKTLSFTRNFTPKKLLIGSIFFLSFVKLSHVINGIFFVCKVKKRCLETKRVFFVYGIVVLFFKQNSVFLDWTPQQEKRVEKIC
ncbi:hypothetical protein RFI_11923 [Reticulomyxa filosa]|uniref:Transmembrane protein n=1 Tax=Reticulomyxa filosa TaxID=46433 RepID=X6NHI7_RETFI|nr:hypothetical protein RFI_11923 [Reticulomyxa filosa]|eukprot:ETO25214.1 hypothetical protein RFI_11923 [Reticulomyxa filosa]